MEKIHDGKKYNIEQIPSNDDEEGELLNNNNKNGICCKDIMNGCHLNNGPAIENNGRIIVVGDGIGVIAGENNIQRSESLENENSVTSKSSSQFDEQNKISRRQSLSRNDSNNDNESLNNSTDNLSYLSENCVLEELFLSDEELSRNSDDCIYAYRGGYMNGIGDAGDGGNDGIEVDDETDFLEMDFEPDPSSELEQSIEFHNNCENNHSTDSYHHHHQQQQQQQHNHDHQCKLFDIDLMKSRITDLCSLTDKNGAINLKDDLKSNENNYNYNYDNNELISSRLSHYHNSILNCSSKINNDDSKSSSVSELNLNTTGAKRKRVLDKTSTKSSSSSSSVLPSNNTKINNTSNNLEKHHKNTINNINRTTTTTTTVYSSSSSSQHSDCGINNDSYLIENGDDVCLDCLEKEFLKTIGEKTAVDVMAQCPKCMSLDRIKKQQQNFNKKYDFIIEKSSLYDYNNDISKNESQRMYSYRKRYDEEITGGPIIEQQQQQQQQQQINYQYHFKIDKSMQKYNSDILCHENSDIFKNKVRFSSINIDEKTIVQALEKLDITYNKDTIREYFDSLSREEMQISDVPELIVFMSKKNCDYKRIIRLIKLACKNKLNIEFIPDSNRKQFSSSTITVEVNMYDILQRWSRKSDLGKLKLLDKRFSEMNVLGKIINLLRQTQHGNTKQLGEFIEIPQYYKSGHICITKI